MTLLQLDAALLRLENRLRLVQDALRRCRDGLEGSDQGTARTYSDRQASNAETYVEQAQLLLNEIMIDLTRCSKIGLPPTHLEGLVSTDVRYPYVAALLKKLRDGKP